MKDFIKDNWVMFIFFACGNVWGGIFTGNFKFFVPIMFIFLMGLIVGYRSGKKLY